MGASSTKTYFGISEELLAEYVDLTYLSRNEIIGIAKLYSELVNIEDIRGLRVPFENICLSYPQLTHNPFSDQIMRVFSSGGDDCFSFEDVLDLCSVMSEYCPLEVKATWAFRLLDFNGDKALDEEDIKIVIDRLTRGFMAVDDTKRIDEEIKRHIARIILKEMDIDNTGSISQMEYVHGVSKLSDFGHLFSFRA